MVGQLNAPRRADTPPAHPKCPPKWPQIRPKFLNQTRSPAGCDSPDTLQLPARCASSHRLADKAEESGVITNTISLQVVPVPLHSVRLAGPNEERTSREGQGGTREGQGEGKRQLNWCVKKVNGSR